MRKIGGIALILLVTGRGFARTPSSPADKVAEPVSKTVRGRVLLPDGTSIGGLMVSIGKQGTPTDSNGRFELPNVPETYDLMIAGQGGRFITAYFGLTRRDPIVTHECRFGGKNREEQRNGGGEPWASASFNSRVDSSPAPTRNARSRRLSEV